LALVNIIEAKKLLEWSVTLSAMTNEVVEAFDDHYSYELNIVKKHKGQKPYCCHGTGNAERQ